MVTILSTGTPDYENGSLQGAIDTFSGHFCDTTDAYSILISSFCIFMSNRPLSQSFCYHSSDTCKHDNQKSKKFLFWRLFFPHTFDGFLVEASRIWSDRPVEKEKNCLAQMCDRFLFGHHSLQKPKKIVPLNSHEIKAWKIVLTHDDILQHAQKKIPQIFPGFFCSWERRKKSGLDDVSFDVLTGTQSDCSFAHTFLEDEDEEDEDDEASTQWHKSRGKKDNDFQQMRKRWERTRKEWDSLKACSATLESVKSAVNKISARYSGHLRVFK